ncbi:MAG: sigma-70 family RNA polymerase sigma factor [Acidimicrobiales bacterium]
MAVAEAHRNEWAYVLAATVRVTRDIDAAEECVQDAFARALTDWTANGIPNKPGAWLTTVARRLALDQQRRHATHARLLPLLVADVDDGPVDARSDDADDDRLRLIFTCCHPALDLESQIALTLRFVCGLTTAEVAKAFLIKESAMAARLTRAKKKIAVSHIPYHVPNADELPDRIEAVLDVVHLVFTTGHTAPSGSSLVRDDLTSRALQLARMLRELLPSDPGVAGLLALILLSDARRTSRTSESGALVLLEDQDRSKWDHESILEGIGLVRESLKHRPPTRFSLMAAIAAVHAEAPSFSETDWGEIVSIYDLLLLTWPSPVVALNRAVAIGFAEGPLAGLSALDELSSDPFLAHYTYYESARADFLFRLGHCERAIASYELALLLTDNAVERSFLQQRLDDISSERAVKGAS